MYYSRGVFLYWLTLDFGKYSSYYPRTYWKIRIPWTSKTSDSKNRGSGKIIKEDKRKRKKERGRLVGGRLNAE